MRAASATALQLEPRADSLWRIDHVPAVFRADELTATRRFGRASTRYPKLTFRKEVKPKLVSLSLSGPNSGAAPIVLGEW